jgi:hypothetical protein
MEARLVPFPFPNRGYVSASASRLLPKEVLANVEGVRIYGGEMRAMPFQTPFADGPFTTGTDNIAGPCLGASTFERADSSFITVAGSTAGLYYYNGNGVTVDEWLPFDATLVPDDTYHYSFVSARDVLYTCAGSLSGGAGIRSWTGAAVATVTADYAPRYMDYYAGRLVGGWLRENPGPADFAFRVRWSDDVSLSNWTTGTSSYLDIHEVSGPITGVLNHVNGCMIYKDNAIFRLFETGLRLPTFGYNIVSQGVGCVSAQTLRSVAGTHFFLGRDDIYSFDGTSQPRPIGQVIREELFAQIDWSKIRRSFALHYPDFNEYWLFIPTKGSNGWPNLVYVYNYLFDTWTKQSFTDAITNATYATFAANARTWDTMGGTWDLTPEQWDGFTPSIGARFPIIARYLVNNWARLDETGVTVDPISASPPPLYFESADTDLGQPGILKSVDAVHIWGRTVSHSQVRVSLSTDGGLTWSDSDVATWSSGGSTRGMDRLILHPPRTTGEQVRLRFESSGSFAIAAILLLVRSREEDR